MTNGTKMRRRTNDRWQRTALYLFAYVALVGGLDAVIAWDEMSVDRLPAITMMMSLLLLGGLTLGFVDRCVTRWFRQN